MVVFCFVCGLKHVRVSPQKFIVHICKAKLTVVDHIVCICNPFETNVIVFMIILVLNYSGSFPPVFATRRNFEKILSVSHLASLVEPEPFKGKWVLQLPVSLLGVQGKPRNYTALKTKFKKQKCFLLFKQIRSWRFARKWSIKRERIKRLCKLKWHKGAPLKKRHFVI